MNKIKAIKTDQDHEEALLRIEALWNAKSDEEKDELDVLATLVEAYERVHHPIDPPDPIEALKFRMKEFGFGRKELVLLLGSSSRATEILNRTRALTVEMIRKLHSKWKIPAETLIQDPKPPKAAHRAKARGHRTASRASRH